MITLITGTPGAGKTLLAVAEELPKFGDRPLFVDGIPDLTVSHEPAPDPNTWHEWLPDNGVLVIDEVQRIWRPRANGSKVPPAIEALETHRHRGADLVLITQHPNLLDQNVRRLVGRHLHVRRVWGLKRSLVYEWDQATDPGRTSTAQKRMWSYPTQAFSLYKSATIHTARGQRPPLLLFIALAALVGLPAAGYYTYQRIQSKTVPSEHAAPAPGPFTGLRTPGSPAAALPFEFENPIISFTPVYPDIPHSAPAYAGLVKVAAAPRIDSCVASRSRCICYTQQATRLQISEDLCRRVAAGEQFDPYRPDQVHQVEQIPIPGQQVEPPEDPRIIDLG
jgi:zona occludens toxin